MEHKESFPIELVQTCAKETYLVLVGGGEEILILFKTHRKSTMTARIGALSGFKGN